MFIDFRRLCWLAGWPAGCGCVDTACLLQPASSSLSPPTWLLHFVPCILSVKFISFSQSSLLQSASLFLHVSFGSFIFSSSIQFHSSCPFPPSCIFFIRCSGKKKRVSGEGTLGIRDSDWLVVEIYGMVCTSRLYSSSRDSNCSFTHDLHRCTLPDLLASSHFSFLSCLYLLEEYECEYIH